MTSELFSSVYKEKSDHLFDDRIFSCPVPAFTYWSIFVPLSENPWILVLFCLTVDIFLKILPGLFEVCLVNRAPVDGGVGVAFGSQKVLRYKIVA